MSVPVRNLLWGLAGAVTVLITYYAVFLVLFRLTLSLYTFPLLLLYLPLFFLAVGGLGIVGSVMILIGTRSPASMNFSGLSFWCGWALCPAGYLAVLLSSG